MTTKEEITAMSIELEWEKDSIDPGHLFGKLLKHAYSLEKETAALRDELERVRKGEWISVKDRLPGQQINVMSMDVLVFTGHGIDVSCYDFELKRWCGSPFMIVTHWMPLPEPPKE